MMINRLFAVCVKYISIVNIAILRCTLHALYRRMYWVAGDDTIYVSKLDGTERDVFIRVTGGLFDGMVLDVRRDRSLSQSLNVL